MTNHWLEEQGVPNLRTLWIKVALAALAPSGNLRLAVSQTRLTTGQMPESNGNRPVQPTEGRQIAAGNPKGQTKCCQTRMPGGVEPVTD